MSCPPHVALLALLCATPFAGAQGQDDAIILVAHPAFRDLEYRQTVLIAAPAPNGGHVGVILNRPTRRSLGSLFPEHEPSKKVAEPVYYGGPFSRGALVALVRGDNAPGAGSVLLMKNLYLAFRANTIDHVIETTPNEARYFVGYVGWRPGELRSEIDRGLWSVSNADLEVIFRKDTEGLWEELFQQSKRIRAAPTAARRRHRPALTGSPRGVHSDLIRRLSWPDVRAVPPRMAALAAALLLCPGFSWSAEPEASLFERLDRNKDGYLSKEELAADAAKNGNWIAIDRDRDGRISRAEFNSVLAQPAPQQTPSAAAGASTPRAEKAGIVVAGSLFA